MKAHFIISLLVLTSCATTTTVQLCTIAQVTDLEAPDSIMVFESEHLIVSYDFWGKGGKGWVTIYNHSDSFVNLNLKECFFILGTYPMPYYDEKIEVSSFTVNSVPSPYRNPYTYTTTEINSKNPVIWLPPFTGLSLPIGTLSKRVIETCDNKEQIKTSYAYGEHLIDFRNIITYRIESAELPIRITHSFYIQETEKIAIAKFWTSGPKLDACGEPVQPPVLTHYCPYVAPYRFYVER